MREDVDSKGVGGGEFLEVKELSCVGNYMTLLNSQNCTLKIILLHIVIS
jgi:hypothetical protein